MKFIEPTEYLQGPHENEKEWINQTRVKLNGVDNNLLKPSSFFTYHKV
jgi:hypothetical protein